MATGGVENGLHFIKDRRWDEDRQWNIRPVLAECLATLRNGRRRARIAQVISSLFNQLLNTSESSNFHIRLKVLRQEKAQAVAVTRLTETMRRPDVSFGIQGRQYSGDAGFREGTLTVSLNLPWWNAPKYRADLRRDEAKVRTVEAEMSDYELSVREEVLRLTLATDAAYREAVLYRDEILQRVQQAMASHFVQWEGNRGALRDILDARRGFLEAQLMQDRALVEQHQSLADLAALCDLPDYFQLARLLVQLASQPPHQHAAPVPLAK